VSWLVALLLFAVAAVAAQAQPQQQLYSPALVCKIAHEHARTLPPELARVARYYTDYDLPDDARIDAALAGNLLVNSISTRGTLHYPLPLAGPGPTFRVYYLDLLSLGRVVELSKPAGEGAKASEKQPSFPPANGWQVMSAKEAVLTPDTCGPDYLSLQSLTGQDRPIVRLQTILVYGMQPPAYDEFLGHTGKTRDEIYAQNLGVDPTKKEARRAAAVLKSEVGNHKKRILLRRSGDWNEVWETLDFADHFQEENDPARTFVIDDLKPAGGEIIYSLPNGLFGYLLVNGKGDLVTEAPANVVSHFARPSPDPTIRINNCLDCHASGYILPPANFVEEMLESGVKIVAKDIEQVQQIEDDYRSRALDHLASDHERYLRSAYAVAEPIAKHEDQALTPAGAASRLAAAVAAVHRDYWAPVGAERAARELGLDAERFRKLAEASNDGNLILLRLGKEIDRTSWEGTSSRIVLQEGQ